MEKRMHVRHPVSCPLKIHHKIHHKIHPGSGEVENACINFSQGGMLISGTPPAAAPEFFASLFIPNTHISYTFRLRTTYQAADSFGAEIVDGPRDFFKAVNFWQG
jgi:hypothetical protein